MRVFRSLFVAAAVATTAAATSVLAAGEAGAQAARIVVVTHGQANDPFWSVVKNGIDAAAKDYGVTAEYRAPDTFDMIQMSQLIDAAVASRPAGLVVSIPDAAALGDSIGRAVAAGIPVVSTNSGADVYEKLGVRAHVGQTEYEAGSGGGKQFAGVKAANAVCVNTEPGNTAVDLRCKGFSDALGGGAETLATTNDPTDVRSAVQAYLSKHPDTQAILATGVISAPPALQALEALHKEGRVKVGTFDLSPQVLEDVRAGKLLFAIDQQQYLQGYLPVAMLALNARYGLLPTGVVRTGPSFVTAQNAAKVIELSRQGIR
jgi:simple sugar transport system substrate-binding protein